MRRKHRRFAQEADLDITAFMNLMIVLVPVLLLSMVFAHTSVLDLNFPLSGDESTDNTEQPLQLQVIIRGDKLVLADSNAGLIDTIPAAESGYDFTRLQEVLKQLKARLPDKRDITILAEKDISYQTLVSAMDTVRSYKAVVAASLVDAELFPDISIGDAPDLGLGAKTSPLSNGGEG
ncbi:MAG: biopolymer transporter ExbD [Hahellaceae bacterium]|nr:biopolymer transporter ExbD [Hahellaceae bacterium]MCP5212164.1 biopolymer transporter ExbD [Hahellaceae bacterium]